MKASFLRLLVTIMTARKYIRIALTPDDEAALQAAKSKAEAEAGIAMSDSMFVLSVIRHALKERSRQGGRGM